MTDTDLDTLERLAREVGEIHGGVLALRERLEAAERERDEARRTAELRQRMIDIPTAWSLTLATDKEQHHERCSYRTAGMLCDCAACRVMEHVSGLLASADARAEAAERERDQALRARDAYDEERREAHQAMSGWKARAEQSEANESTLRQVVAAGVLQREAVERERDALLAEMQAATAALDEWAPLDEGESKPLAQRIRDEGHDFQMLADHCSHIYDHVTHGRISKPTTLPKVVIAEADHLLSKDIDEAVEEATEELTRERDALRATVERLHGICETFRKGHYTIARGELDRLLAAPPRQEGE